MPHSFENLLLPFIWGPRRSFKDKGTGKAGLYVSVAHTAHSKVNSGIQRVTRSIAKEVLRRYEHSDLLEWFIEQNRFILLDEVAREKLSHFSGPPHERLDELLAKEREVLISRYSKGGESGWGRLYETIVSEENLAKLRCNASQAERFKNWLSLMWLKKVRIRLAGLDREEDILRERCSEEILEKMAAIRSCIGSVLESLGEGNGGLPMNANASERVVECRSPAEEAMLEPILTDPFMGWALPRAQSEELTGYFEHLVEKLDRSGFRTLNWVSFLPIPKAARRELRRCIRKFDNTRQRTADRKLIRSFIAKVVELRLLIDRFRMRHKKFVDLRIDWETSFFLYLLKNKMMQESLWGTVPTEDTRKSLDRIERLARRLYPREFLPPAGSWILIPELMTSEELVGVFSFARQHELKVAVVFHDALPIEFPELVNERYRADHERYMRAIAQADCLLPVSEYSKVCYIEWAQRSGVEMPRIEVCLNGVEFREKGEEGNQLKLPEGVQGEFVLCVSTVEPRKNHLKLLDAWRRLLAQGKTLPQLVLVGNAYIGFEDLVKEVCKICIEEAGIVWLEGVSDEELETLYARCRFTVFPSIAEGFGLPILESVWYGRPCLCANFGAMEEAAIGGGCLRIDMREVAAIESGIRKMAFDATLMTSLEAECQRRKLRTWSDYATQVGQLLGF